MARINPNRYLFNSIITSSYDGLLLNGGSSSADYDPAPSPPGEVKYLDTQTAPTAPTAGKITPSATTASGAITPPQITNPTAVPNKTGTALAGADAITRKGDTAADKVLDTAPIETRDYEARDSGEVMESAGVKSGVDFIEKNKALTTVAGQLTSLLDADSAYMQNAKNQAKQQAAALGVLSSSMAIGAAQRSAIEAGLPIAEADAKTYASAALAEQETYNTISKNIADGIVTADLKQYSNILDQATITKNAQMDVLTTAAEQSGNLIAQGALTQMSKELDFFTESTMANLNSALSVAMQNQSISSNEKLQTQNLAANVLGGAQGEMMRLLGDPDFVNSFLAVDPDKATAKDYQDAYDAMWDFFESDILGPARTVVAFSAATVGLSKEYTKADGIWDTYLG